MEFIPSAAVETLIMMAYPMKQVLGLIIFLICGTIYGQSILNGDFENNTAGLDQINLTNEAYSMFMSNSVAFGDWLGGGPGGGNMDIISSNNFCGFPLNENWYVALTSGGTDAISLELSSPLVAGNSYIIRFYDRSCDPIAAGTPIQIGLSAVNNDFGILLYTAPAPVNNTWTCRTFSFIAPINGLYITITCGGPNSIALWTQVDNVSIYPGNHSFDIDFGADTTLCQGDTLTLDASTENAVYLWQDSSANPIFQVSQEGTYWVEVTDICGSSSDTINVTYHPLPTVALGNDTSLCHGDTLTLDATTSNVTYLWQDNSTHPTFDVSQQGAYWVQVRDSCGSTSDTIKVSYFSLPTVDLGMDTSLCQGDTLLLDATTPNVTYLWQDNSVDSTFTVTQPGTYWVALSDSCASSSSSINITYNSLPEFDLGKDTTLCQDDRLTLDASTPNATYLWQDNSTSSIYDVFQEGTYWVETTVNNCISADTIIILEKDCEALLEMPNFFTPNYDGINDVWVPITSRGISQMNTIIFNRWGQKVFETKHARIEWNGQGVKEGVYYWVIFYTANNGTENTLKGAVTIIK